MQRVSRRPKVFHRSIVRGGYSFRLARRLGFEPPTGRRRLKKVVIHLVICWVPLLILSILRGHAWGRAVAEPLLSDPVVWTRFFFALPLLELAQVVVERSLGVQTRHFVESGLVPPDDSREFNAAHESAVRHRGARFAEVTIAILALTISLSMRAFIGEGSIGATWQRVGGSLTLAGWWYVVVSVPILLFFALRWIWIFLLWSWFLFRISRLPLELTPTHPDRAGGLGFLGWGMASFATLLMAFSAMLSGGFAREILHRGSSLGALKYHLLIFVAMAVGLLYAPLFVFAPRQVQCRLRGLLEFGTLIRRHDREFDEKWNGPRAPGMTHESLLGSPDASSLADIATAYEHIDRMQVVPFDKKAFLVLVFAAILPMVPLIGTVLPLSEILSRLAELLA